MTKPIEDKKEETKAEKLAKPEVQARIAEIEAELRELHGANGTTALATTAPAQLAPLAMDASLALEPRSFKEAKDVAMIMAEAALVEDASIGLVLLMRGRPLGLDAMTCATKMFAIRNASTGLITVGMYADLILALTRKHHAVEYIELVSTTAEECTMIGKRKGSDRVTKITWTLDRAVRADLLDRGKDKGNEKRNNWNRYPENMLRARATSELCKVVCPEATMGIESIEVLRDERDTITVHAEVVNEKPKPGARDFAREVDALKLEISAAKTNADKEAIVAKIKAADLPQDHADAVREAYSAKFAKKKATEPEGRQPGDD